MRGHNSAGETALEFLANELARQIIEFVYGLDYMKTPVPSNGSAIADTADAVNDLSGVR